MTVYIGVDFHARSQTISYLTTEDGEIKTGKLEHSDKQEVRAFYEQFEGRVIVGIESSGFTEWFEELLEELGLEIWLGDPAEIRRMARRRQKNDKRDSELVLGLMVKGDFPRVHRQTKESREILKQLRYRHRLIKMRTMAKNSLQAIAVRSGLSLRKQLHTRDGRAKLKLMGLGEAEAEQAKQFNSLIDVLTVEVKRVEKWLAEQASKDPRAELLQTHPGVGLLTSLVLIHTLWPVDRFRNGRKVTAYLGLDPVEDSSGQRVRIGAISKQGSRLARFVLIEAAKVAVRYDEELKVFYTRVAKRRGKPRAAVAAGRKLLLRCFTMLRDAIDYDEFLRRGVEARSSRGARRS